MSRSEGAWVICQRSVEVPIQLVRVFESWQSTDEDDLVDGCVPMDGNIQAFDILGSARRGEGWGCMEESYFSSADLSVEYDARVEMERALVTGFIDASEESRERYRPSLIANDESTGMNLMSVIKNQLSTCTSFDVCVAFVANSGLQPLVEVLSELRRRGIRGRFLTSTYLGFNSPDAYSKLLEYDNIEVRVYQGSLHAKGYVFDHGETSTVIIGSSNLTQTALTCNREWNVMFRSFGAGKMLRSLRDEFEAVWNDLQTAALSSSWIEEYRLSWRPPATPRVRPFVFQGGKAGVVASGIRPNRMQRLALQALAKIHERRETRALLISATGTGKTYLSAFDIAATKPHRVLFLAHRRRILEASLSSFRRLLGSDYAYGIYDPGRDASQISCLFAMSSTIVRHLEAFEPDEFDYIVVDEAHRTGSAGYQRVLGYFSPKFCLGMTATPNRTDGYDVFALFNHVIAFQITLQDALANDMLAPFHYFGIADLKIDDNDVDDPSLFGRLTSDERVRHVIDKIEEYTVVKSERRGLIFCNRNDEAAELSGRFNEYGYRTCALSGESSDEERARAISRLERGELEYIFTVDIFNEGVDIPSLNQIIMLRRTESAIVFVQQLGRGLRKSSGKDYTLVLDFIGNYQKNFLVPVALTGDRTYNKDTLRALVKEGSSAIPGCSTVSFDRIAEARIYEAIDGGNFSSVRLLKDEYMSLKQVLGRIPMLADFDENKSVDPLRLFRKFGSYHAFLSRHDPDYTVEFSDRKERALRFLSQKLGSGKQLEDLLLMKGLIAGSIDARDEEARRSYSSVALERSRAAAVGLLSGRFSGAEAAVSLIVAGDADGAARLSPEFAADLEDDEFRRQVLELVQFGLTRHYQQYGTPYRDTNLVLNAKYTYEEICYLLNWKKNVNGQNIGGYKYDEETNTFPVFINYEKAPDISESTRYEDRFVSERELIAISKQPRYLTSPEIVRLKEHGKNGMRVFLFVRKNKNDGEGSKEFYFLGEMVPTGSYIPIVMQGANKPAVEISYELLDPVRRDLYEYLTSNVVTVETAEAQG